MFTNHIGKPVHPTVDHEVWKSLLKRAKVRDARLHDARHTAATMLQMGRIASGASFDKIRKLVLPATSPFGLDQGRLTHAS